MNRCEEQGSFAAFCWDQMGHLPDLLGLGFSLHVALWLGAWRQGYQSATPDSKRPVGWWRATYLVEKVAAKHGFYTHVRAHLYALFDAGCDCGSDRRGFGISGHFDEKKLPTDMCPPFGPGFEGRGWWKVQRFQSRSVVCGLTVALSFGDETVSDRKISCICFQLHEVKLAVMVCCNSYNSRWGLVSSGTCTLGSDSQQGLLVTCKACAAVSLWA